MADSIVAQNLLNRATAGARVSFELQFNQMQNTLIRRFNDQVDDINGRGRAKRQVVNNLNKELLSLQDALPVAQAYRTNVDIIRGQLESLQTEVTSLKSAITAGPIGLKATKYEGYFADQLNFFSTATEQTDSRFSDPFTAINNTTPGTNFDNTYTVQWQGYFKASTTGQYTFFTESDDSSFLWVGSKDQKVKDLIETRSLGNPVVDNRGLHGRRERSGTIDLEEGEYYPILIYFGENSGVDNLTVSFTPPGGTKTNDGSNFYSHDLSVAALTKQKTLVSNVLNDLYIYEHPDIEDGNLIQNLKTEQDSLDASTPDEGPLTDADKSAAIVLMEALENKISTGRETASILINLTLNLEKRIQSNFATREARLTELTLLDQADKQDEIEALEVDLANFLRIISLSFETNQKFAQFVAGSLSTPKPDPGSVLNLFRPGAFLNIFT